MALVNFVIVNIPQIYWHTVVCPRTTTWCKFSISWGFHVSVFVWRTLLVLPRGLRRYVSFPASVNSVTVPIGCDKYLYIIFNVCSCINCKCMVHTKNICSPWEDISSIINSFYLENRKINTLIINYIFDETIK